MVCVGEEVPEELPVDEYEREIEQLGDTEVVDEGDEMR